MFEAAPDKITDEICLFCKNIIPENKPFFLIPQTGNVNLDCFDNVLKHIRVHGGYMQLGWRIWEWPKIMIEAELHAVWESIGGELVDITPCGFQKILFLPDNKRIYIGRQVDNIRHALVDDIELNEFIKNCQNIFQLINKGTLADKYGEIVLSDIDNEEYQKLEKRNRELMIILDNKYS